MKSLDYINMNAKVRKEAFVLTFQTVLIDSTALAAITWRYLPPSNRRSCDASNRIMVKNNEKLYTEPIMQIFQKIKPQVDLIHIKNEEV